MAKFLKSKSTFASSDTTDFEVQLPSGYAVDDLLLFIVSKDDATGGAFSTPAGWTKHGENNNGASGANTVRSAIYYMVATSTSETAPVVVSTDSDTWSAVCVIITGVDTGGLIDVSNGNGITDSVGNPYPAASVTTTVDDAMVIYGIGSDGGVSPTSPPGFILMGIADSGSDACALAYKMMPTAGASGTCDFYASGQADESVLFTLALKDGSSGAILSGHVNSDCATIVRPLKGANLTLSGDALDSNSNNFSRLAGTWENPTAVRMVDASPLTFTDYTTAATNATDADVLAVPATEATSDYLAICFSSPFQSIRFDRAGCTAGVGGVMAREKLNSGGTTWSALSNVFDSTTSFTTAVADHQIVGFTLPSSWTSETLDGVSGYWMRFRCTTVYTTNPTISQIFVSTSPALYHDTLTGLKDSGVSQIMDSTYVTPGFGGDLMSGGAYSMASVADLSAARLMGTFLFGGPRDYTDAGPRSVGGVAFGLLDSTNLVKAWVVGAPDSDDTYPRRDNIFVIQVDQGDDTSWIGNAPDMTDVKRILLMTNSRNGACNAAFNPLINCGTLKIYGGGTDTPVDYDELIKLANGYPCPMIDRITNICYTLVQVGGDFPVNLQVTGKTITFPKQATVANNVTSFHCDENVIGWLINTEDAADTCYMTNWTMIAESAARFEVLTTADAGTDTDFSGLSLTNFSVILRVFPFIGSIFINCPSFTLVSGASMDSCSLTGTKVLTAVPDDIVDCSFTSAGTGHAIEATATGTFTFGGNTFAGYGADATTDASFYNNSGGLITINLANYTDQTPTVRNGAGASTVINQLPRNINVTGMPTVGANCLLQIDNVTAITAAAWAATTAYASGDKVLRSTGVGTENTAGLYFVATTAGTSAGVEPTWDITPGDTTADGTVVWTCYKILFYDADPTAASLLLTYINAEEFIIGDTYRLTFAEMNGATSFKIFETSGIVSASGFDVAVDAEADSIYAANAIDGSAAAVTNIYTTNYGAGTIVLDANLDFTNLKSYAFYCYELTTSQGMWNFWGGVTALDAANYRNNDSIADILFDESAGYVKQEDSDNSRWFRSDGARPYLDPTTGGSGISMNWKNPVYIADTAAIDIWAATSESSQSYGKQFRDMRAALLGVTTGALTTSEVFKAADGTTTRVTSNNDGLNRTSVIVPGS